MSYVLPAGVLLARLDELQHGAVREIPLGETDWPLTCLLLRMGEEVHAYLNRCPHALRQLNFRPGVFLNADGTLIQCSSHGALFEKDTGLCVAGPCAGESLRRIPVDVVEGAVRLGQDLDIERLERNPFLA